MARMNYDAIRETIQDVVRDNGGQMAHEALINALDPPLPSYVPRLVRAGDLVAHLAAVGGDQPAQLTYHLPGTAGTQGTGPRPEPAAPGQAGAPARGPGAPGGDDTPNAVTQ